MGLMRLNMADNRDVTRPLSLWAGNVLFTDDVSVEGSVSGMFFSVLS
jgi:hypothetical protein